MAILQSNYDTANQKTRELSIDVRILNYDYNTLGNINGQILNGNITIASDTDIRRTCEIEMLVTDNSYTISENGKLWADKIIQIFIGINDLKTDTIDWVNMGMYLINTSAISYSATSNILSFQGVDLMAMITGLRNGNMDGITSKVEMGSNIRNVIIDTLEKFTPFKKFAIEDNPQEVPFDLEFQRPHTVYDILKGLLDLIPYYEMFFDVEGVFRYQKIPDGYGDPVVFDNNLLDNIVISAESVIDFGTVKNKIEVWGKTHEPSYTSMEVTQSGQVYSAPYTEDEVFPETYYGINLPKGTSTTPTLKMGSLSALPIVDDDGNAKSFDITEDSLFVVLLTNGTVESEDEEGNVIPAVPPTNFRYVSESQVYGVFADEIEGSPYNINGSLGEVLLVLSGGEYDNIYTDKLAYERAEYELYLRTRMNDVLTLSTLPIYWADVNTKFEYINEDMGIVNKNWNSLTEEWDNPSQYIIKTITVGLGIDGTTDMTCARFYPEFQWSE